jgi:hypothetical protein
MRVRVNEGVWYFLALLGSPDCLGLLETKDRIAPWKTSTLIRTSDDHSGPVGIIPYASEKECVEKREVWIVAYSVLEAADLPPPRSETVEMRSRSSSVTSDRPRMIFSAHLTLANESNADIIALCVTNHRPKRAVTTFGIVSCPGSRAQAMPVRLA